MDSVSVIDPALQGQLPGKRHSLAIVRIAMAFGLLALLAAILLTTGAIGSDQVKQLLGFSTSGQAATADLSVEARQRVAALNVDDRAQIMAQGANAQARNAAIPESGLPLEKVQHFALAGEDSPGYANALRCLTQAVYYEAAREPLEGRRAVAQVVLNRVRHPAYPKSVCGVVYQGWERWTGCQFSFTCDGSLGRKPMAGPWREAEAVAQEALAGYVEKIVGTATHYHADYVLPKWAFQLGKIDQIGRHIFYRFNGSWGRTIAFRGRYSGIEHVPAFSMAALQARLLARSGNGSAEPLVSGLTVMPHVTDRHAENDLGGRLDTTREWRLSIPDPVEASSRYRQAIATGATDAEVAVKPSLAEVQPREGAILQ